MNIATDEPYCHGGSQRFAVVPLLVAMVTGCLSTAAFSAPVVSVDSLGNVEPVQISPAADPNVVSMKTLVGSSAPLSVNIVYQDVNDLTGYGFDDPVLGQQRRDTAQAVLEYVVAVVRTTASAQLDVVFLTSEPDGTGPLVNTRTYFWNAPGFQGGFAFEHVTTGVDPAPTVPDIRCTVDFGFPWHSGAEEPCPDAYDLFSVLLHELTHGLGFVSLSNASGDSIVYPGAFTFFDRFIETMGGHDCWDDNTAAFVGLPAYLTGGDNGLVWTGLAASTLLGQAPPLYAPAVWEPGTSLSHWRSTLATQDAVMQRATGLGEVRRTYADFEIGALNNLGYVNAQPVEDENEPALPLPVAPLLLAALALVGIRTLRRARRV